MQLGRALNVKFHTHKCGIHTISAREHKKRKRALYYFTNFNASFIFFKRLKRLHTRLLRLPHTRLLQTLLRCLLRPLRLPHTRLLQTHLRCLSHKRITHLTHRLHRLLHRLHILPQPRHVVHLLLVGEPKKIGRRIEQVVHTDCHNMSTAVCNLVAYKAVFGDPIKSASLRREIERTLEEEIGRFWDAEANGDVARAAAEEASARDAIAAIAAREARNAIASIAAREANATREAVWAARDAVWAELAGPSSPGRLRRHDGVSTVCVHRVRHPAHRGPRLPQGPGGRTR